MRVGYVARVGMSQTHTPASSKNAVTGFQIEAIYDSDVNELSAEITSGPIRLTVSALSVTVE